LIEVVTVAQRRLPLICGFASRFQVPVKHVSVGGSVGILCSVGEHKMWGWPVRQRVAPVDKPGPRFSRPEMLQEAEKTGYF